MADDIYRVLGSTIDLWELPRSSDNDRAEVTEFWLRHSTNKVEVSTRQLSESFQQRMSELDERVRGDGGEKMSLLARFVWVEVRVEDDGEKHTVSLSESVQQHILKSFGLNLAYTYFKTFHSGVHALPRVSKSLFDRRSYAFCFGPKRAAIWSHTIRKDGPAEPLSEGLLFLLSPKTQDEDNMKGGTAKQFQFLLEEAPWHPDVVRSPAFPAYLNAIVMSKEITITLKTIGSEIRPIESRTGFHEYKNRREKASTESIYTLAAKTSGYSTKLASATRKCRMVEQLLNFINKTSEEEAYAGPQSHSIAAGSLRGDGSLLQNNVDVLRERLDMQIPEADYALTRVRNQVSALEFLISQSDSIDSKELALGTNAMAHASQNIAVVSQRDAASMKTLAVVTMFFLPGSFISALFSTPLFDWDNVDMSDWSKIHVGTAPQFVLYWLVTIPLTMVTFILYFIWLRRQRNKREQMVKSHDERKATAAEQAGVTGGSKPEPQMMEKDVIAQRRRETVLVEGNGIPMTESRSWKKKRSWRRTGKKDDGMV